MCLIDFTKCIIVSAAVVSSECNASCAADCCDEENYVEQEERVSERHLHFSNQDIDIYDQTPDTVYKDADWPSRVEEYSDYLSR